MSEYVVVLIKLKGCNPCNSLNAIWGDVKTATYKLFPNILFVEETVDNPYLPRSTIIPKSLLNMVKKYPLVFFVLKSEWILASGNESYVFKEKLPIFNNINEDNTWQNIKIAPDRLDGLKVDSYIQWIQRWVTYYNNQAKKPTVETKPPTTTIPQWPFPLNKVEKFHVDDNVCGVYNIRPR